MLKPNIKSRKGLQVAIVDRLWTGTMANRHRQNVWKDSQMNISDSRVGFSIGN